jgi:hypothetical protein
LVNLDAGEKAKRALEGAAMSEELFAVWQYSRDGWHVQAAEGLPAKLAVDYARWMAQTREARDGEIQRIIITDEGDHTVFEWTFGEGVTFQTPEIRTLHCLASAVPWWLTAACRRVRAVFSSLSGVYSLYFILWWELGS